MVARPPVRIGVVGARLAADTHLRALAHLRGTRAEVTAVAAATRQSAEAFARRHEVPAALDDWRALVARPDVDLVDVCCPNDLHEAVAVAAAGAGKHVVVEKPLTGYFGGEGERIAETSRERMLAGALQSVDRILEACRRARVMLGYAENIVYAPGVAKLLRLLEVGGGAFLDLRAEEAHGGSVAAYSRRWRTSGGGSLLRMGSHPIAPTIEAGSKPAKIQGLGRSGRAPLASHPAAIQQESIASAPRASIRRSQWAMTTMSSKRLPGSIPEDESAPQAGSAPTERPRDTARLV